MSAYAPDRDDRDRRREVLALNWLLLDAADDVEAGHDAAECSPALPIVESLAAEVERGLVVE